MAETDLKVKIGWLTSEVTNLSKDNEKSEAFRERVSHTLQEIRLDLVGIKNRIERVERPIAILGVWVERGKGIIITVGIISFLVGGLAQGIWRAIFEVMKVL